MPLLMLCLFYVLPISEEPNQRLPSPLRYDHFSRHVHTHSRCAYQFYLHANFALKVSLFIPLQQVELSDSALPSSPSAVVVAEPAEKNPAVAPEPEPTLPFGTLFRYADTEDWIMFAFSCFLACCGGCVMPCFSLVFGDMLNSFNTVRSIHSCFVRCVSVIIGRVCCLVIYVVQADVVTNIRKNSYYYLGVGAGAFLVSWGCMAFNIVVAERQTKRIREAYVAAVLRQVHNTDRHSITIHVI